MAKKDKSYIRESLSLMGATLPLLGLNVVVYGGFFIVSVIWFIAALVAFWINPMVGAVFVLVTGVGFGWAWRMGRRYLLYLVKGAHIAAITEVMCGRQIPGGTDQIKYGRSVVEKYFKDVSILFGVDMLVRAAVKAVTGTLMSVLNMLPLPGQAKKLADAIRQIINKSLDYIDAAILSHAIRKGSDNVWQSAREGVVLYGQSYKSMLWTAAKAWGIGKVLDTVIFFVLIAPFVGLMMLFDPNIGSWIFIFGLVAVGFMTKLIELAIYEPFANTYMIVTYHRKTEGVEPNPEWDEKLQNMSDKFKELVGKAENFVPGTDSDGGDSQALPPGQQGQPHPQGQPQRQPQTQGEGTA